MASDFTVSDVLAWARTKPADERYDFIDAANCALGQFLRETRGLTCEELYANDPFDDQEAQLRRALNKADQSFGGLVTRLEAIVQETPARPSPWLNPQTYVDADCGENVL